MKTKMKIQYKSLIFFFLTAMMLTLFAPQELKFKYQFYRGKPWQYELLTAPYDFLIYKPQVILDAERDSLRNTIKPYFTMDDTIGAKMQLAWRSDYDKNHKGRLSPMYDQYVVGFLRNIYRQGLISNEDSKALHDDDVMEINLLQANRNSNREPLTRFYTLKEAYEMFVEEAPSELDREVLRGLNLTNYLRVNLTESPEMHRQVVQEELQNLSVSTGMIQAGERIIGTGEIVDTYTYNVLQSFKKTYEERSGGTTLRFTRNLGIFLIIFFLLLALWTYMLSFRPAFFDRLHNSFFVLSLILVINLITELAISFGWFNIYIIPFIILPILVRTFHDSRTAFFAHVINVLIVAMFVPDIYEFILLQVLAGIVSVTSMRRLTSRLQLVRTTFLVFLTYSIVQLSFSLMQDGRVEMEDGLNILYFGVNLIFLMFSYLLVYLMERAFGYVSNISLVELSDVNTPLLSQLSEVAPGTFQHSIQVSILATEAATKIGADVQLVRTGALYHDIGKMKNPSYFTENQGAENPHSKLPFDESARIIIRHVTDGIALAQKHRLPDSVIDFIRTHHGRGKTKYFYNSYCNQYPDKEVDPESFTYPGPNPFSKETGILMMADAIEASSRSLSRHTEEGIKQLIDKIVDGILQDGLLVDTPLTFKDIRICKEVFFEKIKIMYHSRITYPELKKKAPEGESTTEETQGAV
ncbi:hydrolase [Porphyromonas gulae]|uniref:HD family phosphohydrolase n=1 Tax=Porphyromonas gulae TaxID=111105 RepID=UPI00036DF6C6|nr:HDIG domain-containing metalloprotein [Porphyromonas gulae]KGN80678.1 hydrolase [Porphyromonas gulae]